MSIFNELFSTSENLATRANPSLGWISEKIGGIIGISSESIHFVILAGLSFWISAYINRDKGIKFWVVGIALFLFFYYIGL